VEPKCSKCNFSRDFNRFSKNTIIPGQSRPGAKCSHEEKLSRLGECPCLQRRGTRVNSCPGTSKISCEQHYSFIKEPRQFLSRDNCSPRDITLSRVHVNRALETEKRNASRSLPVKERQNIWFNLITKCFSYYPRKLSSFTY
jgi:hypothetical protein